MFRLPRRSSGLLRRRKCGLPAVHCVISAVRLIAVALNLSGRDRGHLVTCSRRVRLAARLRGLRLLTQSCVRNGPIPKKDRESYTEVYCVCPSRPTLLSGSRERPRNSTEACGRRYSHTRRVMGNQTTCIARSAWQPSANCTPRENPKGSQGWLRPCGRRGGRLPPA
jgi:hypothetical protein